MSKNIVKELSFEFALEIVAIYKSLTTNQKEYILSKQLLRSGTAIGALIRESEQAQSRADFVHKLSISLKEANETDYWIELLFQSGYLKNENYKKLKKQIVSLNKLLISIIKRMKENGLK
jgi:four helix bundle protein